MCFDPNSIKCDSEGIPIDSTVMYFPSELFHDTIPCITNGSSTIRSYYFKNKEEYSKAYNVDVKTLKDTFEIAEDTFLLKYRSYTLFKMHEPILYDHYLKKNIYRLTSLRAFHKPLIVRIQIEKDSIILFIKRLNKQIRYPFLVYGGYDSLIYTPPDIQRYDSIHKKWIILDTIKYHKLFIGAKKTNDSLAKLYNVIDYRLIEDYSKTISISAWHSINTLIDSSKFWKTKPNVALDYPMIDGSNWIFEGHSNKGYQIKIIPSPNFENDNYINVFDEKENYEKIFSAILQLAGLTDESLY
jgi:hypothetical protein